MWITYSYDMGSISDCSEKFDLEVPSNLLTPGISASVILDLLKLHSAYIDESTIISYYNSELEAYCKLEPADSFDPCEYQEIELIIKNSKFSELPFVIDKIEELENLVYELEKQGGDQEEDEGNFSQSTENIEIAVLYAAPLVKGDRLRPKSCEGFNINYSREKENMLKEFDRNGIYAEVRFEVATLKNLRTVMSLNPKIIHISCHGYYLKNASNFVLAFESSEIVGLTEEVSQNSLRAVLRAFPHFKGIFMISACYSEAMQEVLFEAGIKYFIVIHKECKIHDMVAIDFAVKFYKNLFLGFEITRSFESTVNHLKRGFSDIQEVCCCCVHKHAETCPFIKSNIHLEHTPDASLCHCDRKKSLYRHRIDCKWAAGFNEKCKLNRTPTPEETKEKHWIICCCHDSKVPHDDYAKFMLKKNTNDEKFTLYSGFEKRDPKDYLIENNLLKPEPLSTEIVGRGKEIYEVLRKISGKNRILMIYGPRNVGKTSVVKYAAQYAHDRKLFKNGVIYVDMKKKRYAKQAMNVIAEKLSCLDLHIETLKKNLESMQVLIIFDNLDLMNEREIDELCDKISKLHELTKYSKFCIVRRDQIKVKRNLTKGEMFDDFFLDKLEKKVVGSLIKYRLTDARYREIREQLKIIIESIDKVPSTVVHYMTLLKDKNITEILKQVESEKVTVSLNEDDSIQNFVTILSARSPDSLKFLKLLSKFPAGVYKSELNKISASVGLNLENVLAVLKTRHNSIIDIDSNIFVVPEKVVCCGLFKEVETLEFDFGSYLKGLAQAIYQKSLLVYSNNKALQSLTGIFFNHETCAFFNNEACASNILDNFPQTDDDPFVVFEAMIENFSEFIKSRQAENSKFDVGQDIYEICIYSCCVHLLNKNHSDVDTLIEETLSHLHQLMNTVVSKHSGLIKRLKLFRASANYEFQENSPEALKKLEKNIESIRLWSEMDTPLNPTLSKSLKGEIYLLKSLTSMKKKNNENVELLINKACSFFSSPDFEVEKGRTMLALVNWLLEQDPANAEIPEYLNFAKTVFLKVKAFRLHEEVNFAFGRHFFQKEAWLQSENYWTKGLELASHLEDRNLEIKYKEKLTQTYAQIRKRSRNVISILRAYPIICHEAQQLNDSVFCTHFSNFKDDLVSKLIEDNKIICLKFEIATRYNLVQQIEQGCRVLHISSVIPHPNKLVLEKEDFSADLIDFNTLGGLLEDKLREHGVELIVFATPNSLELADFCHSNLQVANVVGFDFKQYPDTNDNKYLTQLQKMFEQSIEMFCILFYHHLIEGLVVKDAWKKSKDDVDEFIQKNLSLFEHLTASPVKRKGYEGRGPVLFGHGTTALFSDSTQELMLRDNGLKAGKLINMSSLKPPTNIPRKSNSFVGRHKLMYEIVSSLKQDGVVHVVGEQGIGKTKLIQHIGVYLNGRGHYGLGTYYESLKGCCSLDRFKDLANLDPDNQGKKDLLLIIDDCESILRELPAPLINLIENFHGRFGVHFIISSLPCDFKYQCKRVEIKPLQPLESAGLFMAVFERNLLVKEINSYDSKMNIARNLTNSRLIKDCMNSPSKILKLVERLTSESFNDLVLERTQNNPLNKKKSSELDMPEINIEYSLSYMENPDQNPEKPKETPMTPTPTRKSQSLKGGAESNRNKKRK